MDVSKQMQVTQIMRTELDRIAENNFARKQGLAEGLARGEAKGRAEGLAKGLAEGLEQARAEMVREMSAAGLSMEQMVRISHLPQEKVRAILDKS